MKKYLPIVALLAYASPQAIVLADGADPVLPSDNRIKVLMYDESDVYTITTKYGYQTNLVFGPGEEIQTISMGDRSLWQIIPAGNRLFIRPMDENVITNMTILTNKHSYQFDLKSLAADSKDATPIYVAKFMYPDDMRRSKAPKAADIPAPVVLTPPPVAEKTPEAQKPFVPMTVAPKPEPVTTRNNYNYTYSGPDALAPTQVFDDGRSTYIKYRKIMGTLPKAFIINPDGSERPVSYFTKGDQLVIEEIFGAMALRQPGGAITIYNETLNPK